MSIINVCALFMALLTVQVNGGKQAPPVDKWHQFEYEFKVLDTMVKQDDKMEKLQMTFNMGNERIEEMTKRVEATYAMISHMNATIDSPGTSSGASYIRWGRTACDGDAQKVYTGYTAGSHYTQTGGGSNYLCISSEPKMAEPTDGHHFAELYGTEYELGGAHHNQDVPCVVCRIPRSDVRMIPGTDECQDGWMDEYSGYLVSGWKNHKRTEYVCLDKQMQYVDEGESNHDGALFYYVKAKCGSLRCPPYKEDRELSCVVCSYGKRG